MKNVNDMILKLTKAWNIAKMMECPLTYTFSNKIIPTTYNDLEHTIYSYRRTESDLEDIIEDVYPSFIHMNNVTDCLPSIDFYHDPYIKSSSREFNMFDIYDASTRVLFKTKTKYIQSLYVDNDDISNIIIKNNTSTLNLYAKFLFDENSLCKYLIMPRVKQTTDFKDIYKLNKYKNELEKIANGTFTDKDIHFYIPYTTATGNKYCVFNYDKNQAYDFKTFLLKHTTLNPDVERYVSNYMYNVILAYLELLYTIEHLNDTKAKDYLETTIMNHRTTDSDLENFMKIFKNESCDDWCQNVKNYINETDISKRYQMLCDFASGKLTLLYDKPIEDFCNSINPIFRYVMNNGMNIYLNEILVFMIQTSEYYMRVEYIATLLAFIKDKKLNLKLEECSDGLNDMLNDLGMSTEDNIETNNELFSLPHNHSSENASEASDNSSPTSNTTIDYLNNIVGTFKDGRYEFTVDEKVCTDSKLTLKGDSALINSYEKALSSINLLNKTLIKRIRDIKVYNTGGKNPGINHGKLDRKAIHKYKSTDKIFYNNDYKIKEMDLAFGIILDTSGSMCGKGVEDGIKTLMVLQETLKSLNINFSIITHNNTGPMYSCNITKYHLFREDKSYKPNKSYALTEIHATGGNCDSGALYFMEKYISKVHNKDKIVIMFSDGQPTECTGTDLRNQVKHMEAKGIKVIGVGIGFPEIAEYYSDYANGNNLKQMLDIVSNILQRYVLEKEE